jgi:hypothetical protein
LFWSQTSGMMPWECPPNGAPFIICTNLPFPIPVHITVPISFAIILWRLHY